jgi:membrane protein implicated in regulation of membrane protease activity
MTVSRCLSLMFLCITVIMLIAGQTILKPHLHQQAYIYYWLTCFVFTGLTFIAALLDLRSVRRRSREEQKELIRKTLHNLDKPKPDLRNNEPGHPE